MNNGTHEMDYKRAIKLLRMPEDWFNTEQKAELRNKAITFLNMNPEFAATIKTIVEGKVTDHDYAEGQDNYDRALQGDKKLQEAEATVEEAGTRKNSRELYAEILYVGLKDILPEDLREELSYRDQDIMSLDHSIIDPKTGLHPPFLKHLKEPLAQLVKQRTEEKDKKDKSIKNRMAKFFNKIRGKEVEPTPEEVLLKETETLLAKIDDLVSKKELVEKTRAICFKGVTDKQRTHEVAIRNLIHLLGYDEQELYDKDGEVFHDTAMAKANVEARFANIAAKAYHILPTTDKFEARDTKNIPSYRSYDENKPKFEEFDEMDR